MSDTYVDPRYDGPEALQAAIARDDVETLREAIIAAALYSTDRDLVSDACVELSTHRDEFVRGNAVLGFGHLARRFRTFAAGAVDIVRHALRDPSEHVRGQAWAAADDLQFFAGADIDPERDAP